MSAPVLVGCVAAALCLGIPVLAAGSHLATAQRVTGAADAAALAAADSLTGWLDGAPCEVATEVALSVNATVERCEVDRTTGEARVVLTVQTPAGLVTARARAGGVEPVSASEQTGEWAWPAVTNEIAQGFHDGLAIDLAAPIGSPLFAPYAGVVVAVGPDGGAIPQACRQMPAWWHGENETVILRHEYMGDVLYSSHNHIAPGSAERLGLAVGSQVTTGQPVATAGMSGCTSGPHTHFTLSTRPENAFPNVNPFAFLGLS